MEEKKKENFEIYQTGKDASREEFIEFSKSGRYKKFSRWSRNERGRWRRKNNSIILNSEGTDEDLAEALGENNGKGMEICKMEDGDKKLTDGDGIVYFKIE